MSTGLRALKEKYQFKTWLKQQNSLEKSTRCVQKLLRVLGYLKICLFIHKHLFCSLHCNPHEILNTCAKDFSSLRSTPKKCFCAVPPLMPFSCRQA